MNIYKREVKDKLKSSIIWSISIFAVTLLFMSSYPLFANDAEVLKLMMDNYPKELLQAFGMNNVNLGTVAGYFTMVLLFIQICLAIQGSNYGFSILSVEERERTAEFLLTRPVTRTKIFISKIFAVITALVITNIATWGSTFLIIELFKGDRSYDVSIIIKMMSSLILFQLFFLGVGMVISMLLKQIKSVLTFSMSLSFGMYIISTLGSIIGEDKLSYITPFKYFEPSFLVINGQYDRTMVYLCIVIIIISFLASYYLYIKRNIHSIS